MRFLAALLVLVFLLPATLSGQSGSVSLPIGSEGPSAQLQDLDGNTVELSVEQMQFAENTMRYQTTLTFLNGKIGKLMSAIRGE